MYAPDIVEQRLAIAEEELGWRPEPHSPSEIDSFNYQLRENYAKEYEDAQAKAQGSKNPVNAYRVYLTNALRDKLSEDEARFMSNEQHMSMCDAKYWLTRHFWIKNDRNVIQRFAFRKGQEIFFQAIAELEQMGAAIEIIEAKARQLGVSTITEGLIEQRVCFTYGVNAVIASASQKQIGLMSQMLFLGYDEMSWWLPPLDTRRVESEQGMLVFGGMRSGVSFQHGAQTSGIARGYTPTVYHLSEVASYQNAEQLIEASLFKCVHPSRNVLGILESSCEGDTGWWADTYWTSKRNWSRGRSRLYAQFLPWYLGTDLYPTETWIRTRPVPEGWHPSPETRSMMARARLFVMGSPLLAKILGPQWEMGREQAWYWEVCYEEAKSKGLEKLWFQEMPTDDVEAFQGSYDNVFGRETIVSVFESRKKDPEVYGIVGQSIESRLEPSPEEIDYRKPRIPIVYRSNTGEVYRWEFVPLLWKDTFNKVEDIDDFDVFDGKLFIYHRPEPGYDYSLGVDTSNGIGSDATAIAVCRRAKYDTDPDVQVAEFRSIHVSHVEAFAFVLPIAAYYSRYMEESTNYREPYVSIEQIAAVGDTCQVQMRKMGYSRFHRMIRYDSRDLKKSKSHKNGWYTSSWSRPMLTDGFVIAVQNGWYVVNSPATIWEMNHWEVHLTQSGKSKFEHSSVATDDGVFANAMATFCPNDLKALAKRSNRRVISEGDRRTHINIAPIGGYSISTGGASPANTAGSYDDMERQTLERYR